MELRPCWKLCMRSSKDACSWLVVTLCLISTLRAWESFVQMDHWQGYRSGFGIFSDIFYMKGAFQNTNEDLDAHHVDPSNRCFLPGNTRRYSWPSGNSPRGHFLVSRTLLSVSSGSPWSTKNRLSTPQTSPDRSPGSKILPCSSASLTYGIGEALMTSSAFSLIN